MKRLQTKVLIGSALGVLLVAGAWAGDDVRTYGTQFNQPADQQSADMAATPRGARGPLREDRMSADQPSADMAPKGAAGRLQDEQMRFGVANSPDGHTAYGKW